MAAVLAPSRNAFGAQVREAARAHRLVVQPRMGFADPAAMRAGLAAVKTARASTVGTLTLDSFTRVGDDLAARRALQDGDPLNGYPLLAHDLATTRAVVEGLQSRDFPIQVRHGSALPERIIAAVAAAGLDATEGGPISYCLPYSRVRLREATVAWQRSAGIAGSAGLHVETFGGCLLGQLCPPSLLIAVSVAEALFFAGAGVTSLSLSYAQQTSLAQDVAAVRALRRLAGERLAGLDWHTVVYTFMGVYPATEPGSALLLADSVRLAVAGGAERLIVKTAAEAHRIPEVADNVRALEQAGALAEQLGGSAVPVVADAAEEQALYDEARLLLDTALDLDPDPGTALAAAFERGLLDIPYCLHPDNANLARTRIDASGRLVWAETGSMPLRPGPPAPAGAEGLLRMLHHNQDHYDRLAGRTP